MIQSEFLAIANQYPNQINVWITLNAPYKVQGVSIPIIDKTPENILQYLQQAETVILPVSSTQTLRLKVTAKSVQYSGNSTYYFLNVEEIDINAITPISIPNAKVIVLPGLDGAIFDKSPYNVLQGSVELQRQSDYITQFGSTTKAYIQDSSYSNTGWINARYEGSVTNTLNYKTIEPALTGNTFKGNYYPSSTTDDQINTQASVDRVTTNYLHTGNTQLPEFSLERLQLWISSTVQVDQNFMYVKTFKTPFVDNTLPNFKLKVGDLIQFERDLAGGPIIGSETARVDQIIPVYGNIGEDGKAYKLFVTRRWGKTVVPGTYEPSSGQASSLPTAILRILPVRIFELQGNKVQGASQGKIRIVETSQIIGTDQLGFVVTGSLS